MNNSLTTLAKMAMVAGALLMPAALTGPTLASGNNHNYTPPGWDFCYHHHICFKSGETGGGSEGNFPSRCNGVLGFWTAVPMPGNQTFCVARSTADFFHNASPTCTIAKGYTHDGEFIVWRQKVISGSICHEHQHNM